MSDPESFLDGKVMLWPGDCLDVLATLDANSIDSCVTDPPYHLTSIVKRFGANGAAPAKDYSGQKPGATGAYARASSGFMGKKWDGGDIAFQPETWAAVFRVLKPGSHLIAFSGTRTYHRMACAIEDAGFEIRDQIGWCFGSGFPKSHSVALAIDKINGAGHRAKSFNMKGKGDRANEFDANGRDFPPAYEPQSNDARTWAGFGTALKPAWEPCVLARKPLSESTVAANVLKFGTGGLNIDGCRVATDESIVATRNIALGSSSGGVYGTADKPGVYEQHNSGRWPANIIHDGSDEVVRAFPESDGQQGRVTGREPSTDDGSAARFFYTAKADSDDRLGSRHPTVKPLDLMQYLVRLVTPKGGTVLDPFSGTGTTGEAAFREGCKAILIEREEEYQNDIRRRMALVMSGPGERSRESIKARVGDKPFEAGSLFA